VYIYVENAQIISNKFMNYNKSAHSFVNYLPNQEINYYQLCRSFSSFLSATATPGVKVILISNSKISIVCFNLYINEILQYLLFSLTYFTLTLQFRLLCTADILYLAIVLHFCCCMVFYYMKILLFIYSFLC